MNNNSIHSSTDFSVHNEMEKFISEITPNNHYEAWAVIEKALAKAQAHGAFGLDESGLILVSREFVKNFIKYDAILRKQQETENKQQVIPYSDENLTLHNT